MLQDKLLKIQKELKAPKSQLNAFGKYNYRSCEDILEAVKPLLEGVGLCLSDEMVLIGDRYYVKATVKLYDGDEVICVTAYAREELDKKGMDSSQITGAASSYARKYALNGLFLIDDTTDSDATNKKKKDDDTVNKVKNLTDAVKNSAQTTEQEAQENKTTTYTPQQIRTDKINVLLKRASDAGITTSVIMRGIQPKTLTTITVEELKAYVNSKIDEQNK